MKLADSHCHILDPRLVHRADEIAANLEINGLDFIVEISASIQESRESIEFANKHDRVFCTIGVHPHTIHQYDCEFERWALSQKGNKKLVAYGECGLDYYHLPHPKELQREIFTRQILLADQLNLPLVVHTRDAFDETMEILVKNKAYIRNGLLFHCFSEGADQVAQARNHFDAYFAFGGGVTYNSVVSDGAIKAVPLDRMLLETDSPYQNPKQAGGKKLINEPKNVLFVAEYISGLLNKDIKIIAENTLKNTYRFFKIV